MDTLLNPLTELTLPQVLAWCLRGTAVLAAAAVVALLMRKRSAGARHLVWLTGLAGLGGRH